MTDAPNQTAAPALSNRHCKALAECREWASRRSMMGPWKMVSMADLKNMGLVEPHHSRAGLIDGWVPTKAGMEFPL